MRHTAAEKHEIIRLVEGSDLPVLHPKPSAARQYWNRIPARVRQRVVDAALEDPERSPRELAWQLTDREGHFLSESSVYRILKAYDLIPSPAFIVLSAAKTFQHPTHRLNELWQTDFTYLQVVGWGWYYLSTVLDDYSRYIIAWTLRTSMQASDVTETLDLARAKTGVDRVRVAHRPRLLSDNGPCYISGELADYLETHKIAHTRGAPYHPMTQGQIERYHRSMKNVVKLEKYYSPWELERAVARFIDDYNHRRLHGASDNVTPIDVYEGRRPTLFPSSSTSRTALALNSSSNCRRGRRFLLGCTIVDIVSAFQKVSTKSDQAHTEQCSASVDLPGLSVARTTTHHVAYVQTDLRIVVA